MKSTLPRFCIQYIYLYMHTIYIYDIYIYIERETERETNTQTDLPPSKAGRLTWPAQFRCGLRSID